VRLPDGVVREPIVAEEPAAGVPGDAPLYGGIGGDAGLAGEGGPAGECLSGYGLVGVHFRGAAVVFMVLWLTGCCVCADESIDELPFMWG